MTNKTKETQLKKIIRAFEEEPKTMLQVETETGIMRSNICWYVRALRRQDKITVTKVDRCPVTKHKAQYLSTNQSLIRKGSATQINIFQ